MRNLLDGSTVAAPGGDRLVRRVAAGLVLAVACIGSGESGVMSAEQLRAPSSGLARNPAAPFAVSLIADAPVPIRIGSQFRLQLSSGSAGYASIYVLDPVYTVRVLAENLPLAAGSVGYPDGITLVAEQPVGFNTVILLVTRQPFGGFAGNATLTNPVSLAIGSRSFVPQLNRATRALPPNNWAVGELTIRVVG